MELTDYSTEELRAELARRQIEKRRQVEEKMRNDLRCRNCKHCQSVKVSNWTICYQCAVRTWGKKIQRHYTVKLSNKACDKFERKTEYQIKEVIL